LIVIIDKRHGRWQPENAARRRPYGPRQQLYRGVRRERETYAAGSPREISLRRDFHAECRISR
jgi:hypothetical protein